MAGIRNGFFFGASAGSDDVALLNHPPLRCGHEISIVECVRSALRSRHNSNCFSAEPTLPTVNHVPMWKYYPSVGS